MPTTSQWYGLGALALGGFGAQLLLSPNDYQEQHRPAATGIATLAMGAGVGLISALTSAKLGARMPLWSTIPAGVLAVGGAAAILGASLWPSNHSSNVATPSDLTSRPLATVDSKGWARATSLGGEPIQSSIFTGDTTSPWESHTIADGTRVYVWPMDNEKNRDAHRISAYIPDEKLWTTIFTQEAVMEPQPEAN